MIALRDAYKLKYYEKAKVLVEEFLKGKSIIHNVAVENATVLVKAVPGTYVYTFLDRCANNGLLEDLLIGDFTRQLEIINEVRNNSALNLKTRVTKTKYPQLKKIKNGQTVILNDFNTILRAIFVDGMFDAEQDNPNHLDKAEFVRKLGLKYCPYCAETRILPIKMENGPMVKPQIDHFLPKSKYPFLAMNFFNLIPSCTVCNESPNKHSKDPLGEDGTHKYLMQPHDFDGCVFEFDYDFDPLDFLDESRYNVKIDYKGNTDLEYGYKKIIYVERLYQSMTDMICDMYGNMHTESETLKENYGDLGLRRTYWSQRTPFTYFHGWKRYEHNTMFIRNYKFLSDIYHKMHAYFENEWNA